MSKKTYKWIAPFKKTALVLFTLNFFIFSNVYLLSYFISRVFLIK